MERQDFCKEKENAICEEIKNIKKNENTRQEKEECEHDWEKYTNINVKHKFIKLVLLHQISGWVG